MRIGSERECIVEARAAQLAQCTGGVVRIRIGAYLDVKAAGAGGWLAGAGLSAGTLLTPTLAA